jgi:hypothetical protein
VKEIDHSLDALLTDLEERHTQDAAWLGSRAIKAIERAQDVDNAAWWEINHATAVRDARKAAHHALTVLLIRARAKL